MKRIPLAAVATIVGLMWSAFADAVEILDLHIASGLEWQSRAYPLIGEASPIYSGTNWESYACPANSDCSNWLMQPVSMKRPNGEFPNLPYPDLVPRFASNAPELKDFAWAPIVPVPNSEIKVEDIALGTIVPGTNAQFMWSSQGMEGSPTGSNGLPDAFFRFEFEVTQNDTLKTKMPLSAIARIIADDRFDLYFNGKLIQAGTLQFNMDSSDPTGKKPVPLLTKDFGLSIRSGPEMQVLAIHARDGYPLYDSDKVGCSSFLGALSEDDCGLFNVQHRVNQFLYVETLVQSPEPATDLLVGSGMVGMVWWRRKQVR